MATTTTRLTIEDFERLPAEQAKNHELVNGELVEVAGNIWIHNRLRDGLAVRMRLIEEQGLGVVVTEQEFDFDGNGHAPDVSFVCTDKIPLLDPLKRIQPLVPDLAIEIASPSNTFQELMRKKDRYRRCGTREVWILNQDSEEVYVYSEAANRILSGRDEIGTPLIPGFAIRVDELFRLGRTW